MKTIFSLSILIFFSIHLSAQQWADSVMKTLTPDQRIAQLMHVAVTPGSASERNAAERLIRNHGLGGILLMSSDPSKAVRLVNEMQAKSKVPLLVSVDGEWGPSMRMDSTTIFPYAMSLGGSVDDGTIYDMGVEVARQCKRMGIHMNFAPVIDVNNNPRNPVIGFRSFGEDPERVYLKAEKYAAGMIDGGVVPTFKHFPGHGDTGTDSHVGLPVIKHNKGRLMEVELKPYRMMTESLKNSAAIMVGHLNVPALDPTPQIPATLSKPIITDLLKGELGFTGLVVTDALNMKGVLQQYPAGEVEVRALIAGNDALLFSTDIPKAIRDIRAAINSGRLTQQQVDESCLKILRTKEWAGLNSYQPIALAGLVEDLNSPWANELNQQLVATSLTLLRNRDNRMLPFLDLGEEKIATVSVGRSKRTPFQNRVSTFEENFQAYHYNLGKESTFQSIQSVRKSLGKMDKVIICIHQEGKRPGIRTRLSASLRGFVNEMALSEKAVIVYFRNPYTLKHFQSMSKAKGLLLAYQDGEVQQEMAAELIFGKRSVLTGKLPVTVSADFPLGDGVEMPMVAIAVELEIPYYDDEAPPVPKPIQPKPKTLTERIDSIALAGIAAGAYPGCQVYVAHKGEKILHKAYGFHTYEKRTAVKSDDIYDLASVTKCSGPLPALMKLHGQGKFKLDVPFSTYWKDFRRGDKSTLTVREVLAHQARLKPYLVYYANEKKEDGTFKRKAIRTKPSGKFSVKLTDSLYLSKKYTKRIYKEINKSPLMEKSEYLYSGLSFLLYPEIITQLTGIPYEQYLQDSIYLPIGAKTLGFNAGQHFPLERIPPTERDTFFRHKLLHGEVHDEAAAMMGGVSGNAGLFSNAEDLAKLWQMYMNGGEVNGVGVIPEATVKEFSKVQYPQNDNRRGLGFDKPLLENPEEGYAAPSASASSFGHSGYTGTMVWADPENELLFIFLSNRVYPTRENRKLYELNIRPSMHEAIYEWLRN